MFEIVNYNDQFLYGDFIERTNSFFYIYNNKLYGSEILLLGIGANFESSLSLIQQFSFPTNIINSYSQDNVIYLINSNNQLFSLDFSVYGFVANNPITYSEIDPTFLVRTYSFSDSFLFEQIEGVYNVGTQMGIIVSSLLKR